MNKKRFLAIAFLALSIAPVAAQYRVDRLITAGRSALYYEDYVLSIKYFNLAIGAKPYLYEPWYYRSVAKFSSMTIRVLRAMLQKHCISTHISMISMTYVLFAVSDRAKYDEVSMITILPSRLNREIATIGSTVRSV